jgi:hypothetical protein
MLATVKHPSGKLGLILLRNMAELHTSGFGGEILG